MLKIYFYNGKTYQFDDANAPSGAVEVVNTKPTATAKAEKKEPEAKAVKPANKSKGTKTK